LSKPTELIKGTLDLLVLRTLELEPLHGVAIADRIRQTTRGAFDVKAGSLFPALHRLEDEGWIVGAWQESAERRRVKSYALTAAGRRKLTTAKAQWRRVVTAMDLVLEG
jgi:PadR family transcriptional regulator, regulatory protein PadR